MKKRWQEYTGLYKRHLNDPDNQNGVLTHLEPHLLGCKVKWALGSITMNKANGGDGIPVELFQILKDDAVKVLHSICQQIWKIWQWSQVWKRSVFIPIPKKGKPKNVQTTAQLTIWWCPCEESSLVLLEEGVWYDQCVLLAKLCWPLPYLILYSKAKFALVSLDFQFLHSNSL